MPLDDEDAEEEFWAYPPSRRVLVFAAIAQACAELQLTAGGFRSAISNKDRASFNARAIRRFINAGEKILEDPSVIDNPAEFTGKAPELHAPHTFSPLARAARRVMAERPPGRRSPEFSRLLEQLEIVLQQLDGGDVEVEDDPEDARAAAIDLVRAVPPLRPPVHIAPEIAALGTLARYLRNTDERLQSGYEALAGTTGPADFLCYRFHSASHQVIVSRTQILPPTPDRPIATFLNFVTESAPKAGAANVPRVTEGIVLPVGQWLYLIGAIEHDAGLKIIVVKRPSVPGPDYDGLILCLDKGDAVTARMLLVRASEGDLAEAPLGPTDVATVRKRLGDHELNRIRNFIPFKVEDDRPVKLNGAPVKDLVKAVRTQLEGAGAVFTFGEDEEFNPADDEHYTYNAGLKMYQEGER